MKQRYPYFDSDQSRLAIWIAIIVLAVICQAIAFLGVRRGDGKGRNSPNYTPTTRPVQGHCPTHAAKE